MVGRLPFIPGVTESIPSLLGGGAIHEAMLGRLKEVLIATFASGLEPHGLEPCAHRSPLLRVNQMRAPTLRQRALCHILPTIWAVVEFRSLNLWMKSMIPGGAVRFFGVLVAPLGGVTEERSVPHVAHLLPVPVSGVPLEVGNKPGFEDPVKQGFLTWEGEVLGQSKSCSMTVLSEHPDGFVSL